MKTQESKIKKTKNEQKRTWSIVEFNSYREVKKKKIRLYTGREKRGTFNILWRNGLNYYSALNHQSAETQFPSNIITGENEILKMWR